MLTSHNIEFSYPGDTRCYCKAHIINLLHDKCKRDSQKSLLILLMLVYFFEVEIHNNVTVHRIKFLFVHFNRTWRVVYDLRLRLHYFGSVGKRCKKVTEAGFVILYRSKIVKKRHFFWSDTTTLSKRGRS